MKVIIISDIHDNLTNLYKCLDWARENSVEEMICCGDVTNSETLSILSDKFDGKINLVKGNIELFYKEEIAQFKNINYFGKIGRASFGSKVAGFCHEPYWVNKILEKNKYDIIFHGHTHRPWEEQKKGLWIINPGALSGGFQKATFAVWDTEKNKLELKILELL